MAVYSNEEGSFFGIARNGVADMTKQQALFSKNGGKTQGFLRTREDQEKFNKRTIEYLKDERGTELLREIELEKMNVKAWKARQPGYQEDEEKETEKSDIEKVFLTCFHFV